MEGIKRCSSAMVPTRGKQKMKSVKKLNTPIKKIVEQEYKKLQTMNIIENPSTDKEPESPFIKYNQKNYIEKVKDTNRPL